MKSSVVLLLLIFAGCTNKNTETKTTAKTATEFSIVDASFPLFIDKVDFGSSESPASKNPIIAKQISKTVRDFYDSECGGECEPYFSLADCYVKTIRLTEQNQTLFVVVLQGFPVRDLIAKVLFYDNHSKQFIGEAVDFKIYALYDFENGKITASDLKTFFKMTNPEIELTDENQDGVNEFKFTRLFHNGTFNAIDTQVLKVGNGTIDTISNQRKAIGALAGE